jgi:hypothetical protein
MQKILFPSCKMTSSHASIPTRPQIIFRPNTTEDAEKGHKFVKTTIKTIFLNFLSHDIPWHPLPTR